MAKQITLVVAGPADIDADNAVALLEDYTAGYDEVNLVVPMTDTHLTDGLLNVLDFAAEGDIPVLAVVKKGDTSRTVSRAIKNVDETEEVINVEESLIRILQDFDGEHAVLLLWGDDGSEECEVILDNALSAGVPVKDLSAGLDDLTFDDGTDDETLHTEPLPDDENVAAQEEPEQKPKRAKKAEVVEELQDEETELTEDDVEPEPEPDVAPEPTDAEVEDLPHDRQSGVEPLQALTEGQEAWVREIVRQEVDAALYVLGAEIARFALAGNRPEESTGATEAAEEPVQDPEPAPKPRARRKAAEGDEKVRFVRVEDGTLYRKGRGRPRKDEEIVELTLDEARAQGWDGD